MCKKYIFIVQNKNNINNYHTIRQVQFKEPAFIIPIRTINMKSD